MQKKLLLINIISKKLNKLENQNNHFILYNFYSDYSSDKKLRIPN